MARVYYDRVKDTFTTTGTGTLTVANSAPTGYLPTSTVGNSNSAYFVAYDSTMANWEVFSGTYTSSGTTLSRDTVLASSNSGSAVNWAAGTKTLELVSPATFFTNALRADVADQTISGGANVTSASLSTGNVTIDCGKAPLQYITNNGAYTITAPSNDGSCILLVTNGASAGATTFSGFTIASGSAGAALTTTNTNKFYIMIWRINGTSGYCVLAAQ
jgi:hypothetical protein